jgi:hypothetical protein
MAKSFIPGLRIIVQQSHKYATRYQSTLSGGLTGPQYTALLAFIACCAELLAALGPANINP